MKGVRYLVDDAGQKTAVVIDLKHHRELWEDLCDQLLARRRAKEPRESLEQVRERLRRRGKLRRHG